MSWTTELAAAETAEQTYRATRKGSQNSHVRWDARGGVLATDWVQARAAVSSAAPASNTSFWLNVAMRAVSNMGPSWSVVTAQLGSPVTQPLISDNEMRTHAAFGFPGGTLDGLFAGVLSAWTTSVWTTSGRTVPSAAFPPDEVWTFLLGNTLQLAGAT